MRYTVCDFDVFGDMNGVASVLKKHGVKYRLSKESHVTFFIDKESKDYMQMLNELYQLEGISVPSYGRMWSDDNDIDAFCEKLNKEFSEEVKMEIAKEKRKPSIPRP